MKKVKVIIIGLLWLGIIGALCGCGKNKKVVYGAGVKTYEFTDSYGRIVTLPKAVNRIVPTGINAQMILYTIAPEAMVGVSSSPSMDQMEFFPEAFINLPTLGQFYGKKASLNLENLLNTDAQVIIDLGEKKENGKEDMDAIQKQTGIAVVFIEATIQTYPQMYQTLGQLLGKEEAAEDLAEYCSQTIMMANQNASKIPPEKRLKVLYGSGTTGLNCNAAGSIHAAVIDIVGAQNGLEVTAVNNQGGGNPINMEQLYQIEPDVILLEPGGPFDRLASDPQWQQLKAVKEGRYYEIPTLPYNWMSSPPSVNQILGVRWLGGILYPELYNDDIKAEVQNFYRLFWHYELSDAQAETLLAGAESKGVN